MANAQRTRPRNLSNLEQLVMDYVWLQDACTADACRAALIDSRPMKDSTIRTVLRRLEAKGYVIHELEGRTFIYRAAEARENVAARAVKHIIDRFCDGSAEQLVMGLVDSKVLGCKDLERLARKISQSREGQRKSASSGARPSVKEDKP